MKIGIVSDSLAHFGFEEMLDAAAALGVQGIEMNTGNWSSVPHLDLSALTADAARTRFLHAFDQRGLRLIALNANGNQLHPGSGARQSATLHQLQIFATIVDCKGFAAAQAELNLSAPSISGYTRRRPIACSNDGVDAPDGIDVPEWWC